jgi:quinohemoprotein amine dehydrogenase
MLWSDKKLGLIAGTLAAVGLAVSAGTSAAADAEAILSARCGACHAEEAGGLSRINAARKTPEGWLMTIVRMGIMHGLELPADERRTLVKYLADTQGLAPSEAASYRYILERQPAVVEDYPPEYFYMCARCHSGARGSLQRRTKENWRLHIHFHLGQWPTTEYQFYGRDREWFQIGVTETTDWLYENYPFESAAWDAWKGHQADASGEWRWVARGPGIGFHQGVLTASGGENDSYSISNKEFLPDGSVIEGSGSSIVYTGYEWRLRLTEKDSGNQFLGIGTITEDGNRSTGRYMRADQDEIGADYVAVRVRDGHSEVMAVEPAHIRAGATAQIAIHGTGLSGSVDLGPGVEVVETVSTDANAVVVTARADAGAALGSRSVSVGGTASAADAFVVYDKVAAVSVEPFDEVAAELDDVGFAGMMNPNTGIYDPADAGLNPARPFETNNAGNLKVIGTVDDAGKAVIGEGQLVVTVQRWNDPPIR